MLASALLAIFGLTAAVSAAPTTRDAGTLTAQDLIKIAPGTATCDNADAAYPKECATAEVAAANIARSFKDYNINTFGAQAALVSLILLESGQFKYDKHHFPSPNPGQGTRNMQSWTYNSQYATYLAKHNTCGITQAKLDEAYALGENKTKDAVVDLLNSSDHVSFGSAAWFLRTQCPAVAQGLASGTEAAYTTYVTKCVGTAIDDDRLAWWKKAMALKRW